MSKYRQRAVFNWEHYGKPYCSFSALCDQGDWNNILSLIASNIGLYLDLDSCRSNFIQILDVGAGTGETAISIRRFLYSSHRTLSGWDLFDPDIKALDLLRRNAFSLGKAMPVGIYDQLPQNKKYDVILFCHSTYYIDNITNFLNRCYLELLNDDGILIFLCMPSQSSFFNDEVNSIHYGVSEDVVESLEAIGVCDIYNLCVRSRFFWSQDILADEELSANISTFITGELILKSREIDKIKNCFGAKYFDFTDNLMVVKKK